MNQPQLLKQLDIRFWNAQADGSELIYWNAFGSMQQPEGDYRRVHPDDWSAFKTKISQFRKAGQITMTMRVLVDGKWNWYSFRTKHKPRQSLLSGVMIPLKDEMEHQSAILELSQTKEKVYRALGHDLKGQFSSLLGFSDILLESYHELDEASRLKYIGYMKTIASNTFLLVDNMLNWAKIRQGQIALDNQVILLTDKLEEVLGYIQFALKTKRIQLVYRFKKDFSLQADQVLITSLLLNLITNAAKFSEEGSKIVIKASKKDNHSVIQIQDEGIGFEPQLLAQIFDPEVLHSRKGTRNESGTGLGLKICKEFIQLMGGKMHVFSKEGKGTKITLTIPEK